jgi:hypothetical protein
MTTSRPRPDANPGTTATPSAGSASARSAGDRYLRLYLTNHWLASKGGLDLFERSARSQHDDDARATLRALADEVAEDRTALRRILDAHRVQQTPIRERLVSLGETLGRLKPNGTLVRRSPLSDLLELEALGAAVHAKKLGWLALRSLADDDDRLDVAELDDLVHRAEGQQARLEGLRLQAARAIYPAARPTHPTRQV